MRNARDTMLHYLADNLTSLNVVNVRRDSNDPANQELTVNAINVEFLYDRPGVQQSSLQVSIDVIYDDEFQAISASESIWKLLSASEMTPLLTYVNSLSSPQPLGPMLRWNCRAVKFNKLVSDLFFRYNCHLLLSYSDPTLVWA